MPQTFYTAEEYEEVKKKTDLFMGAYMYLVRTLSYSSHDTKLADGYDFIPFQGIIDLTEAFTYIFSKLKGKRVNLVDVGCGYGNILCLAEAVGREIEIDLRTYGIEYNPKIVEVIQSGNSYGFSSIIEGDALEQDYSKYDVIYWYNPLSNREKERELEEKIYREAKEGCYFIGINVMGNSPVKDREFSFIRAAHTLRGGLTIFHKPKQKANAKQKTKDLSEVNSLD